MVRNNDLTVHAPNGLEVAKIYVDYFPELVLPDELDRHCGSPVWAATKSLFGIVEYRPAILVYQHINWPISPCWTYIQDLRWIDGESPPEIPPHVLEWADKDKRLLLVSLPTIGEVRCRSGVVGTATLVRIHAVLRWNDRWTQVADNPSLNYLELEAAWNSLAGNQYQQILIGDV